jgi:hypothetical protein
LIGFDADAEPEAAGSGKRRRDLRMRSAKEIERKTDLESGIRVI